MKTIFLTLFAGLFAVTTATARPLTPNEIFTAIDGTYDHTIDDSRMANKDAKDMDGQRVNFSLYSMESDDDMLNSVLAGVDGEYNQ